MIDNKEISDTIQKASVCLATHTVKQADAKVYKKRFCESTKNVVCIYLYIFALESYLEGEEFSEEEIICILKQLQNLI